MSSSGVALPLSINQLVGQAVRTVIKRCGFVGILGVIVALVLDSRCRSLGVSVGTFVPAALVYIAKLFRDILACFAVGYAMVGCRSTFGGLGANGYGDHILHN